MLQRYIPHMYSGAIIKAHKTKSTIGNQAQLTRARLVTNGIRRFCGNICVKKNYVPKQRMKCLLEMRENVSTRTLYAKTECSLTVVPSMRLDDIKPGI